MKKLLHLALLGWLCRFGVGCGPSGASGPQPTDAEVEEDLAGQTEEMEELDASSDE